MQPFSLLIKPASADCNLRCRYCFYLDHAALYPSTPVHRMEDAVLERMIASYMRTDQPQYSFGWQGGEPTLMGVDFYRRVVELQKRHAPDGASVCNGLQTNGVLIDDELAEHLARYNFLVGVSLDGPAEIHDQFRRNAAGRGSHADALRGIERLAMHGVEYNILTLISQSNVHRGAEVYRYLRDRGFLYHQYIPCVEYDEAGRPAPFAISGEEWGEFMCGVFDEWVKADTRTVSVRLFDSIVTMMVNGVPNVCHMAGNCCQYFVVEHNGDIYPCDFFVEDGLKLGNVMNDGWPEMQSSEAYLEFGRRKQEWDVECDRCRFRRFCMGDCRKHRGPDHLGRSELCSGWRTFLAHSLPTFERLSAEVRRAREAERLAHVTASFSGVGRNDPCPCGSGRKFKKCHGSNL